jgi:hypothetical protein
MSNIAQVLTRLREDRKQAEQQVQKLTLAINVLEKIGGNSSFAGRTGRAKRVLSAAGRRRISLAQKARWARMRHGKKAA